MENVVSTYEGLVSENPLVSGIVTEQMAEVVFDNSGHTENALGELWMSNLRANLKLLKKHEMIADALNGFGKGKAVIAVGAGASFNLNKYILKQVYDYNIRFLVEDQPFIIIATNKMFKPLLKMGIHPHFVVLVDAGDVLYDQLCTGIAKKSKNHILITGFHCSPKILKKWDDMGNHILFYLIGGDNEREVFEKHTKKDGEIYQTSQGGNIINTLWIMTIRYLHCSTYIMMGNDLSFKYSHDKKEREESFYAAGDYRTNILNKRDEAKDKFAWMGIDKIYRSPFVNKNMVDFELKSVSRQLWIYKTWLEVQAAVWSEKQKFFIINASESGVLGVLAKDYNKKHIMEKGNWFLIDEILPKRWLTTTLDEACASILKAKLCLNDYDARVVESSPAMMGTVNSAGLNLR